jgi:hypothetical protein
MKFLDKLLDRFRKKVDAKNDEVKRNTESYDRLAALGGILGVGGGVSAFSGGSGVREAECAESQVVEAAAVWEHDVPLPERVLHQTVGPYSLQWAGAVAEGCGEGCAAEPGSVVTGSGDAAKGRTK